MWAALCATPAVKASAIARRAGVNSPACRRAEQPATTGRGAGRGAAACAGRWRSCTVANTRGPAPHSVSPLRRRMQIRPWTWSRVDYLAGYKARSCPPHSTNRRFGKHEEFRYPLWLTRCIAAQATTVPSPSAAVAPAETSRTAVPAASTSSSVALAPATAPAPTSAAAERFSGAIGCLAPLALAALMLAYAAMN